MGNHLLVSNDNMFEESSIRFYSLNATQYAAETIGLDMSKIYPHFLRYIPEKGKILDAGCGSGRDSVHFLQQGYTVTAFDASKEMCQEASRRLCQPVQQLRFEQLAYNSVFDGVWASASLVHTPWDKQKTALEKLLSALKPGGVLYASWKYGDDCHTEEARSFCDMNETRVLQVIGQLENARLLTHWISYGSKNAEQKWLNIICQKGDA